MAMSSLYLARISAAKGKSHSSKATYEAAGLFQSYEEIAEWPVDPTVSGNTNTTRSADIKYIDQDESRTPDVQ